ncbi:glucosyltransferase, partial [Elasticomyces elasticus]
MAPYTPSSVGGQPWIASVSVALVTLAVISGAWLQKVAIGVTEPYLDEVFHVGQAQQYCAGNWHHWDSKITTPPGLYVLSYVVSRVTGSCSLVTLRALNTIILCALCVVVFDIAYSRPWKISSQLSQSGAGGPPRDAQSHDVQRSLHCAHTALNICLFPPLFFFSALYYTDVASTFFVLVFLRLFLHTRASVGTETLAGVSMVLLGAVSLAFRQTNIFWVAIFPAGILLMKILDDGPPHSGHNARSWGVNFRQVVKTSWTLEYLYDVPVRDASIEDYVKTIVSAAVRTPEYLISAILGQRQSRRSFRYFIPCITLLVAFGAFVLWNGGVVL